MKMAGPIAVTNTELTQYGCPSCGYAFGSVLLEAPDSKSWTCDCCSDACLVLSDATDNSSIGVDVGRNKTIFPEKASHPRKGIPAHINLDVVKAS